jgi:hypothetical protein
MYDAKDTTVEEFSAKKNTAASRTERYTSRHGGKDLEIELKQSSSAKKAE